MTSDKKTANAVGGKTARACDSCIRRRARWYCAADDAFLCQACDSSVHSANPLARRHERVRLKTGSLSKFSNEPSWLHGFTRKARSPRPKKPAFSQLNKYDQTVRTRVPSVPEVGAEETSIDDSEAQTLQLVPSFDPLYDNLSGFFNTEMEFVDVAADVESLLGKCFDHNFNGMEELDMLDCKEKGSRESSSCNRMLKIEDDDVEATTCPVDTEVYLTRESFELNFDYDSPATLGEEEEKEDCRVEEVKKMERKRMELKLDHEAIIEAWASKGSPWALGDRPEFDSDDCWPACMGSCGIEMHHPYFDLMGGVGAHMRMGDGGREARVSRYREKRRNRLFSKKIRYEVRKLNAEKRPRLKGRFVKRPSFTGPPCLSLA